MRTVKDLVPLLPKPQTFAVLEENIFKTERIRIIFLVPSDARVPRRVNVDSLKKEFDPDQTMIMFYEYIHNLLPDVKYVVVSKTGMLNPNGHTKIKNVAFALPKAPAK